MNARYHVKSYFADSMDDALERARQELGPDALLLNDRPAPPEARHLGQFEIVFGIGPEANAAPAPTAAAAAVPAGALDDVRRQLEELRGLLIRGRSAPNGDGIAIARALAAAGVDAELASDVQGAVQQRVFGVVPIARARNASVDLVRETIAEVAGRVNVAPELKRISAFVGPAGVGKTTVIVKLAVNQGLLQGRKVLLISTDGERIAATEQMQAYAAIAGVPFQFTPTAVELASALERAPANALVLIDTPGYSVAKLQESGAEWMGFLGARQDIDTHLVLTAYQRLEDLRRTVDRYRNFHPAKLLFTHLDETSSSGSVLSEAVRTGLPVSFLSTGQNIPEDIEPATMERLCDSLVRELPNRLEAVA